MRDRAEWVAGININSKEAMQIVKDYLNKPALERLKRKVEGSNLPADEAS
ncbi:MAG: hypothetical protein PHG35_02135 [Dehalococcoidales bacterium]|nr:hypothetical protein [Dehalococcoidales bacterium]